jgi:hypothetical protein
VELPELVRVLDAQKGEPDLSDPTRGLPPDAKAAPAGIGLVLVRTAAFWRGIAFSRGLIDARRMVEWNRMVARHRAMRDTQALRRAQAVYRTPTFVDIARAQSLWRQMADGASADVPSCGWTRTRPRARARRRTTSSRCARSPAREQPSDDPHDQVARRSAGPPGLPAGASGERAGARRVRPRRRRPDPRSRSVASGEPFTAGQALWIHFFVNAPFGIALGFDLETPGLMRLRPRPRGESVVTRRMLVSCGLVGLFIAIANLLLIQIGKHHYGSVTIGSSIALTAFTLMLVVAAYHSRSETGTIFTSDTFNSRQLNWTALAEIASAWLITQSDFLRRLLGTTELDAQEFGITLLAAVLLALIWELGKWIARRGEAARDTAQPAG